jgi:6-phosphogluconolactonase/glucosamine-6-phosphate isomerase/deaminase
VRLVIEDDAAAVARTTAAVLLGTMLTDRRTNLSVTAGATPAPTYALLTPLLAARPEVFADVHYYTFDEAPLPGRDRGLTLSALDEAYFGPAAVAPGNVHALTPGNVDEIRADLRAHGGLDLMLLGLGADTHFCANLPGVTRFDADIYTYEVPADQPWSHLLTGLDPAPTEVVTMGAPTVLRARRVVLVVTGAAKAGALAEVLTGEIRPERPGTILRTHPDLLVVADREAAARLPASVRAA